MWLKIRSSPMDAKIRTGTRALSFVVPACSGLTRGDGTTHHHAVRQAGQSIVKSHFIVRYCCFVKPKRESERVSCLLKHAFGTCGRNSSVWPVELEQVGLEVTVVKTPLSPLTQRRGAGCQIASASMIS